jgi:DMSO/TMAO reductase YedYZ heme-binding membrane subunit
VLHYFWLVKKDIQAPLVYGAILLVLFGTRLWLARGGPARRTGSATRTAAQATADSSS